MKTNTGIRSFLRLAFAALLVVPILSWGGCGLFSSDPLPSPADNQRARLMAVPEDKALVYVYRNAVWAHSLAFELSANGQTIGDSPALFYYLLEAKPGKLTLTSQGNSNILLNLIIGKSFGFEQLTLELVVEAGKKYFVFQDVRNWEHPSGLRLVEEKEGWAGMTPCRLSKVVKITRAALPKTSAVIPAKPASKLPSPLEAPGKPASDAPAKPLAEPEN